MSGRFDLNAPTEISSIASLFGFSTRRANQILAAAGVARIDRGRVPLKPALQACLRSIRDGLARRRARSADGDRLLDVRAKELESRNARTESKFVPTAEHRAMCTDYLAHMREAFASAPARITADPTMQERLRAEFDTVFDRAERRLDELTAEALRPGRRQ